MLGKCPVLRSSRFGCQVCNTPAIGFSARAEPVALWLNIRRLVYAALGLSVVAGGSSQSLYLNHRLFIGAAHQREPCRDWCHCIEPQRYIHGRHSRHCTCQHCKYRHSGSLIRLRCSYCSGILGRGQSFRLYVAASPLSVSLIPCFSSFIFVSILRVTLPAHRLVLPRKVITSLRNVKVVHSVFDEKSS